MRLQYLVAAVLIATLYIPQTVTAQSKSNYIRIAQLVIDSARLENYREALKLHAETAVRVEAGVLMLYAVYDKQDPTHVSVFEIYESIEAYNFHIKTAHFLKYKATVENMVKSLELHDVVPISLEAKTKIGN